MNIAILLSGGVDSSVALYLLKESGIDPVIFYIKIGMEDESGFLDCNFKEDVEIVLHLAKKYGCKAEIVSLQEEYWEKVISYTIESVKAGLTPNPDIMCNKLIKFGVFEDKIGFQFDKTATGHYARVYANDKGCFLQTAVDSFKDQTYFLSRITQAQLSKLVFPIGGLKKKEVREMAEKEKMPNAERPDSQGICFLGKINYRDFLKRFIGEKEGKIIELESGKILGIHKGFWFYTIGQRQGLGLGQGPWFVVNKDTESNTIFVSNGYDPESQYKSQILLRDFHFINPALNLNSGELINFKIRHTPEFTKGVAEINGDSLLVHSRKKIAGVAPGQFGVIYDAEKKYCIGSGIIV